MDERDIERLRQNYNMDVADVAKLRREAEDIHWRQEEEEAAKKSDEDRNEALQAAQVREINRLRSVVRKQNERIEKELTEAKGHIESHALVRVKIAQIHQELKDVGETATSVKLGEILDWYRTQYDTGKIFGDKTGNGEDD